MRSLWLSLLLLATSSAKSSKTAQSAGITAQREGHLSKQKGFLRVHRGCDVYVLLCPFSHLGSEWLLWDRLLACSAFAHYRHNSLFLYTYIQLCGMQPQNHWWTWGFQVLSCLWGWDRCSRHPDIWGCLSCLLQLLHSSPSNNWKLRNVVICSEHLDSVVQIPWSTLCLF